MPLLPASIIGEATRYWAADLGCPAESLFTPPLQIIIHGGGLEGYDGIFALFREGISTISFPPDCIAELSGRLPTSFIGPETFAELFAAPGRTVIGPAWIGYADEMKEPTHSCRATAAENAPAIAALRVA